MKLVQKSLIHGTQEIVLGDDAIDITITTPLKKENLSVVLAVLRPEPVVTRSRVEFVSRVNSEALISLYRNKPNKDEFEAFVEAIKEKASQEYDAFAGVSSL